MKTNTIEQFRQAMADAGLMYSGELIADGSLHRFNADGDKPTNQNSWYVLHDSDFPAGAFGCWQRGVSGKWRSKSERRFTAAEREQYARHIEQQRQQREREQKQRQLEAKKKAERMWADAQRPQSSDEHFYTKEKDLFPFGVRVLRGMFLVPVFTPALELVGLQLISRDTDGKTCKRFLTGTPIAGNYCTLGKAIDNETIAIGEGWATMASVHAATGLPCVVAFSAGNLLSVAQTMRAKFPDKKIILCADDDDGTAQRTGKNAGIEAATKAAAAVRGYISMPSLHQSSEVAV